MGTAAENSAGTWMLENSDSLTKVRRFSKIRLTAGVYLSAKALATP